MVDARRRIMFVDVLSGFGPDREGMSFARRIRADLCSPNIHLSKMFDVSLRRTE